MSTADPVPLKISIALLLLVPSMYCEIIRSSPSSGINCVTSSQSTAGISTLKDKGEQLSVLPLSSVEGIMVALPNASSITVTSWQITTVSTSSITVIVCVTVIEFPQLSTTLKVRVTMYGSPTQPTPPLLVSSTKITTGNEPQLSISSVTNASFGAGISSMHWKFIGAGLLAV